MKKIVLIILCTLVLLGCDSKTPQELIIGKWEKTNLDDSNDKIDEGYKVAKIIEEYYLDGDGYVYFEYVKPTKNKENSKTVNFKFSFVREDQVKYLFGVGVYEFFKIIELTSSKLITQGVRDQDSSDLSGFYSEYRRIE